MSAKWLNVNVIILWADYSFQTNSWAHYLCKNIGMCGGIYYHNIHTNSVVCLECSAGPERGCKDAVCVSSLQPQAGATTRDPHKDHAGYFWKFWKCALWVLLRHSQIHTLVHSLYGHANIQQQIRLLSQILTNMYHRTLVCVTCTTGLLYV